MTTFDQENMWRSAQALARDPAAQEVLRRLETRFIAAWRDSAPDDERTRENAYRMIRTLSAFRDELTALAAEPTVAQFNRRLMRQA